MLAVSPIASNKDGNNKGSTMEANYSMGTDDFPDFSGANLLDSIDFDELFMGMHDGDVLPDLDEMDPDLLVDFSINTGEDDSASEFNNSCSAMSVDNIISPTDDGYVASVENSCYEGCTNDVVISRVLGTELGEIDGEGCGLKTTSSLEETETEEGMVESKKDIIKSESTRTAISSSKESHNNNKKSSSSSKSGTNNSNHQGKRKTKVDWTPELHRRFVQAVEQLGVDKAVPSRILELMGIDCLTRHNIASHLQKYRSHRKHLLAREAEAASWTQKRQMYGLAMGGGGKGGANISPWYPPTMGFPQMTTPMHPPFRPLHVWGHPTMNPQARLHLWPKQVVPSTTPLPPTWAPPPPPPDPSFWHSPHQRRAAVALVPGIPPHTMYRPDQQGLRPPPAAQSGPQPSIDLHPSKESIDSAIGDVLAKPWLPLPIGLKPPSMDSVMVELQRQGIPKIPPSCA